MKLRAFKWGDQDDPAHVVIDVELASVDEVKKMQAFLAWLEREVEGIPVDLSQELQEAYEANKPNLCPHGMNPASCFDAACRSKPVPRVTRTSLKWEPIDTEQLRKGRSEVQVRDEYEASRGKFAESFKKGIVAAADAERKKGRGDW